MALRQAIFNRIFQLLTFLIGLSAVALIVLTHPFSFYKKKRRTVPPSCLIDPSLGKHGYITANGIKFHYVSNGDPSKPVMLFVHGFPEFWFSWRYQLKYFSHSYHVIAIDMRGYGETDKPAGKDQYTMELLVQDIVQLVKILSPDRKCILVGHDWGGLISWKVVQKNQQLFDRFIVMNCPHSKILRRALSKGWNQTFRSWYIFLFQSPWIPEILLSLVDFKAFTDFKKNFINSENFSDDAIEAYKHTFGQRGALTPPINYYRNMLPEVQQFEFTELINTPTLIIWGENDQAFDISLAQQHSDICTNITIKLMPNCSHWVHQDCPEMTNQYMNEFLQLGVSTNCNIMKIGRIIFFFCFQILSVLVGLLALALIVLTHPLSFYKKKRRTVPPSCLIDPSLGKHGYITANGIKFHYVSNGDPSKPVMLFVHGFPEFWFSWRYQLKYFSHSYHVIAIDMRGYGETDKPAGKYQYTMELLVQDIVQLVKILSPDRKCILVGHDWGGAVSWAAVQKYPELFDKLIIMNCPHAKIMGRAISKGWKQIFKIWYTFFFQVPVLPELLISLADYKLISELKNTLFNPDNFSDDVVEAFKFTFSQRGALTPPINYYRSIFQNVRRSFTELINTPTLLIWGENDQALDISLAQQHSDICTNITIKSIPNCSHWVQQDCPEITNQYMNEFLQQ